MFMYSSCIIRGVGGVTLSVKYFEVYNKITKVWRKVSLNG